MKRVYIFGYSNKSEFTNSQRIALENAGYTTVQNIFKADLYLLNWYENIYKDKNQYLFFLKKIIFILIIKILNKKVFFYIHNIKPHKKDNLLPNYFLSNLLFNMLFIIANKIIIISRNTKYFFGSRKILFLLFNYKIVYIPHPNMIHLRCYQTFEVSKNSDSTLKLLYFGSILKYKNVEVLIDVVNSFENLPIKLDIVGVCNKEYYTELISRIRNDNIRIVNQYYQDEELFSLFKQYDLCVYPFDKKSSLNSSSIILAFSMSKTVISPNISTLLDYSKSLYFSYEYNNYQEHFNNLRNVILTALDLKTSDNNILQIIGEKVYDEVRLKNSQEIINQIYYDMLKN